MPVVRESEGPIKSVLPETGVAVGTRVGVGLTVGVTVATGVGVGTDVGVVLGARVATGEATGLRLKDAFLEVREKGIAPRSTS